MKCVMLTGDRRVSIRVELINYIKMHILVKQDSFYNLGTSQNL